MEEVAASPTGELRGKAQGDSSKRQRRRQERGRSPAGHQGSRRRRRKGDRKKKGRETGAVRPEGEVGPWSGSEAGSVYQPGSSCGPERKEVMAEEDWLAVQGFAKECSSLPVNGRSAAQMGVVMVQLVHKCPGLVGRYARSVLETSASSQGTDERLRDVLPLPVDGDAGSLVGRILADGDYKVKKSGVSGGAIKNQYRQVGIECFTYCMVVGLNLLWAGLRKGARVCQSDPSAAQLLAMDRLRKAAAYMIDSMDGSAKGGVPRTPQEGWDKKMKQARISYHGEIVAKAEPLELDRVLASLPPEGFGGVVDILDVCDEPVRSLLEDPHNLLLADEDLPKTIPRPKVRVMDGEWEKLARALFERGIVAPTEDIITVEGVDVTNGLFGVEKVGKDLPDGRTAQRLIMDLRGSNAILKMVCGDVKTLAGAAAFTTVALEENFVISISGDDLVSSFYLFRLPSTWTPFLAFEKQVAWQALGVNRPGKTYLGACVLPMGFNSSVGIMQHIHRRMALRSLPAGGALDAALETRKDREWPVLSEETPAWCLYLDDSTFLRKLEANVSEALQGKTREQQEQMRRAYQFWGIPYNLKKAIEETEKAERLGGYLDGRVGRIGVTATRFLESLSLGIWILKQGQTSRKSLQVFAGKEVHCLQFRRPLFSVYDEIWRLIAGSDDCPRLNIKVCSEIVVSLCLSALRYTDWRAGLDPYVMASDASEFGGGFCMARRLTDRGLKALQEGIDRDEENRSGVIVFDFFAGIGGLLRSLERAGVCWEHHVVVEKDKKCRRCIRRTWPGASEYTDIAMMTKEDMIREIDKVDNPILVVGGGGSPCQGLSKLSSERQHFEDERSKLFFDLADRLDDLKDICKEKGIRFLGLVENVVMDEKDRDEISYRLGWWPHLVESGDLSWVRRPRFFWLSRELPDAPWFEILREETALKIRMYGDVEPIADWVPPGLQYEGESAGVKLPTFTRPIWRRRPPKDPAGLKGASEAALNRWRSDSFRFPPYTYEQRFLLSDDSGDLHKVPASSREFLMGFHKDHTKKLDRELFEKVGWVWSEDERQAALGNSFHTTTVALILGTLLFNMGILDRVKGPDELLQDLIRDFNATQASVAGSCDDAASEATEVASLSELEAEEALGLLECAQDDLDEKKLHEQLMGRLVHIFLRKVEMRGSDIRLDTSVLFRSGALPRTSIDPSKWEWKDCRAFKWRRAEHINCLELRAALHCLQWRSRRSSFHSFRTMILIDNQAILAVIAKGRSSSRVVNHLLRRLGALCCALNLFLLVAWVDTADNPADSASRRFDDDRKSQ